MRKFLVILSAAAFTAAIAGVVPVEAAKVKAAAKTKMGCTVGKEKWDAGAGKCAAAAPVKKAAKKA